MPKSDEHVLSVLSARALRARPALPETEHGGQLPRDLQLPRRSLRL